MGKKENICFFTSFRDPVSQQPIVSTLTGILPSPPPAPAAPALSQEQ